jgi:hypothetical protein
MVQNFTFTSMPRSSIEAAVVTTCVKAVYARPRMPQPDRAKLPRCAERPSCVAMDFILARGQLRRSPTTAGGTSDGLLYKQSP